MTQLNFEAIGTKWQIDIYKELGEEKESSIFSLILERIDAFDKIYSRFRTDSLVTKMSKEVGNFVLGEDAKELFSLYQELYKLTNGLFTPLVGNILSDAGYDSNYSLKQKNDLQIAPLWEEVLEYKYPNITIKKPAILDFGAGGKGYLVDLVGQLLEKNNIFEYCIDAGGDILHKNNSEIRVGLENPENLEQIIGVYPLKNKSICGSAHNRRKWDKYSHIINPKTLSSPKEILAVWVIAEKAMLADALATCLFFVPASTLQNKYDFEYVLIKGDHQIEKSKNFSGEIFTK